MHDWVTRDLMFGGGWLFSKEHEIRNIQIKKETIYTVYLQL